MRKALALDLGSKCGWATNSQGFTWSGTQDFTPSKRESSDMRFVRFHDWFTAQLKKLHPEIVVYEMPHNRGGSATEVLNGMAAIVQLKCGKSTPKIPYTSVHSATLKRHATGRGNAKKPEMIEAAERLHPDKKIKDDNEADALLLLDYVERGEWR